MPYADGHVAICKGLSGLSLEHELACMSSMMGAARGLSCLLCALAHAWLALTAGRSLSVLRAACGTPSFGTYFLQTAHQQCTAGCGHSSPASHGCCTTVMYPEGQGHLGHKNWDFACCCLLLPKPAGCRVLPARALALVLWTQLAVGRSACCFPSLVLLRPATPALLTSAASKGCSLPLQLTVLKD